MTSVLLLSLSLNLLYLLCSFLVSEGSSHLKWLGKAKGTKIPHNRDSPVAFGDLSYLGDV